LRWLRRYRKRPRIREAYLNKLSYKYKAFLVNVRFAEQSVNNKPDAGLLIIL
jgi:hypothetical protein